MPLSYLNGVRGRLSRAQQGFVAKFRDPVVTDRSIDLAFAVYWACFAWWGVAGVFAGIPTIADNTTAVYELLWGSGIGLLATIATVGAVLTFFPTVDVRLRIRRKSIEMVAALILLGFIAVYPLFVMFLAATGDQGRVALVALAVQYLIFPAWRARHLYLRIRALREMVAEEQRRRLEAEQLAAYRAWLATVTDAERGGGS